MPSSTSSSSDRLPSGPWLKTWLLVAIISFLALGSWELLWRSRGALPSRRGGYYLWTQAYHRVQPDSIVLLGTSRIQAGVNPELLAKITNRSTIQLGIHGSSPIPVLDLLASEAWFHGTVVVDLVPHITFDATRERERDPSEYIEAGLRSVSPATRTESYLTALADQRLVFRRPDYAARKLINDVLKGSIPNIPYRSFDDNRFARLDFTRMDTTARTQELRQRIATHGRAPDEDERDETIARIMAPVSKIEARGGRVMFIRMPTTGGIREIEEERYPRAVYWDVLADRFPGKTFHSDDFPALARFDCPDESHIEFRDTPAFTTQLASVLGL